MWTPIDRVGSSHMNVGSDHQHKSQSQSLRGWYTMENGPNAQNGKNVENSPDRKSEKHRKNGELARFSLFQAQILAVWIFAPKLPNSDLNFAVDSWVDFIVLFSQGKGPKKSTKNSPTKFNQSFGRKNPSQISAEAFS